MLTETQLDSALLDAFNSLSEQKSASLDYTKGFEEVGLDSLGMNQILLHLEESLGRVLSDEVLEKLSAATNIGDIHRVLRETYVGKPD